MIAGRPESGTIESHPQPSLSISCHEGLEFTAPVHVLVEPSVLQARAATAEMSLTRTVLMSSVGRLLVVCVLRASRGTAYSNKPHHCLCLSGQRTIRSGTRALEQRGRSARARAAARSHPPEPHRRPTPQTSHLAESPPRTATGTGRVVVRSFWGGGRKVWVCGTWEVRSADARRASPAGRTMKALCAAGNGFHIRADESGGTSSSLRKSFPRLDAGETRCRASRTKKNAEPKLSCRSRIGSNTGKRP